jgi:plastocyanin
VIVHSSCRALARFGTRDGSTRGRQEEGTNVTFEFLADQTGIFPFSCNLTLEDGCHEMKGRLVVRP